MYVSAKESCHRHTLYTSLLLNSSDCLVEFLSEKKFDSLPYNLCIYEIGWCMSFLHLLRTTYNLASWPISLPVVLSCSRLVLLFITESSAPLRLNYWYLYQCLRAQDRTIADQQITIALKLTFKNRHTESLHCFFQRCK